MGVTQFARVSGFCKLLCRIPLLANTILHHADVVSMGNPALTKIARSIIPLNLHLNFRYLKFCYQTCIGVIISTNQFNRKNIADCKENVLQDLIDRVQMQVGGPVQSCVDVNGGPVQCRIYMWVKAPSNIVYRCGWRSRPMSCVDVGDLTPFQAT